MTAPAGPVFDERADVEVGCNKTILFLAVGYAPLYVSAFLFVAATGGLIACNKTTAALMRAP